MDDTLARLARALRATPEEPEVADALEAALLRAGRLDEAYLLRWRRGEPSPVAEAVAASQRPTLDALAADPACAVRECACQEPGCPGGEPRVELDDGGADGPWAPEERRHALGPTAPIVGLRLRGAPGLLGRLGSIGTLARLDASPDDLGGPTPATVEQLDLWLGQEGRPDPVQLGRLPSLRSLHLNGGRVTDERLEEVLAACRPLEELRVGGELLTDAGLEGLGHVQNLRRLEVWNAPWLDGSGLAVLAESGAPLERLLLAGGPRLGERAFTWLGELTTLTDLTLHGASLDVERARDLAGLARLRRLTLSARLDAEALDPLAEAPIEELVLQPARGSTAGALAGVPGWTRLRSLALSGMGQVASADLAALGLAPRLEQLSCAWDTRLDDEGLVGLCRSTSLRRLGLPAGGPVTARGLRALVRLPRLERLHLVGATAPLDVLDALAWAPALSALGLCASWEEPAGLDRLGRVATLPRLERLELEGVVAPGALAALADAPRLRELRVRSVDAESLAGLARSSTLELLEVRGDRLERARLQAALPRVRVSAA